eukprot:1195768-Pyramimonas_sp.AAC.1
MTSDGITHATTALAVHGLTLLPSGEIGVLSIKADDILVLDETKLMENWQSFLNPDASHDEEYGSTVISIDRAERAYRPMPVLFRACHGHYCFAHSIERMHAPCEFGMAQCHGHLLHVTSIEAEH